STSVARELRRTLLRVARFERALARRTQGDCPGLDGQSDHTRAGDRRSRGDDKVDFVFLTSSTAAARRPRGEPTRAAVVCGRFRRCRRSEPDSKPAPGGPGCLCGNYPLTLAVAVHGD